MQCIFCGEKNDEDAVFCGSCGKRLQNNIVGDLKPQITGNICLSCGQPLDAGALFCGSCGARIADMDDVLDHDDEWSETNGNQLILFRERTGERIVVDNYPFVIGRSRDCDYIIMNNLAIGRKHISLDLVRQRFYITDLGSSNHTFVGGRQIKKREEIYDGMKIIMADESFYIQIL